LVGEQRAGGLVDYPPSGGILLKRLLKGAHEQVAFCAVVEDDAKPGVDVAVLVGGWLIHCRDVCFWPPRM
jgi:hypothetical protein